MSNVTKTTYDSQDIPTIWGLTPVELHNRFWVARGVQVIRQGESAEISSGAELYLLLDARTLAIFRLRQLVESLSWLRPKVMWVRIRDRREKSYREQALCDGQGRFVQMVRDYGGLDSRQGRVALTSDPAIARLWQSASDARSGWQQLRMVIPKQRRETRSVNGSVYDLADGHEVASFANHLVQVWKQPHSSIGRNLRHADQIWKDRTAQVADQVKFIGPVWIGAGRAIDPGATVVGPAVLWDAQDSGSQATEISWGQIDPSETGLHRPRQYAFRSKTRRWSKRLFDLTLTSVGLVLISPIFPLVMLAIWLEDGRPFFFAHQRETLGGREFPCLKFRSMRKDADEIKQQLMDQNQVDGPQFYIKNDPRLTQVGKFIRKYQIDELPQLFNVLLGHMALVGPRPSPRKENQYCPAWREARLSVRPGLTGLWQVKRTRQTGQDFQEWIKYDIEYVENANLFMDLSILWKTLIYVFGKDCQNGSEN